MLTRLVNEYAALAWYTKLFVDISPFVVAILFWLPGALMDRLFEHTNPTKLHTFLRTTGLLLAAVLAFSLFAVFMHGRTIGVGSSTIKRIGGVGFVGGVCVYLAFALWKSDRSLAKDLKKIDDLEARLLAELHEKQSGRKK